MKKISLAVTAMAVLTFAGAASAQECKINGAFDKDNKGSDMSFFSSNTNSGKGNGGETATKGTLLGTFDFTYCTSGLAVDDHDYNANANDPDVVNVTFFGIPILYSETATDPGNSPN
jgi:hypothetical protein